MKKFLVLFGILVSLITFTTNSAFCQENNLTEEILTIGRLVNSQRYDEAMERCNSALITHPESSDLYYWRAIVKSFKDEKASSITDFDKAVKLSPENAMIYVMRGISKADLGDYDGALADYNKSIELNPNEASAYTMRACIKIETGDLKGANEDLEKANKLTNTKFTLH